MYEIYDHHSDAYDALVSHEDYQGNLRRALRQCASWRDAVVVEAGIGTGRVTRMYIDLAAEVHGYDRSSHMLEQATLNLSAWSPKLELERAEHREIPAADHAADIFVEGWAFGHVAVDHADDVRGVTRDLVGEAERITRPGGKIILLETLGTNVESPEAPLPALEEFYGHLERSHGFSRAVIRTDYEFDTAEQAEELCAYFFGEEIRESVRARASRRQDAAGIIIPEFTGMWSRG